MKPRVEGRVARPSEVISPSFGAVSQGATKTSESFTHHVTYQTQSLNHNTGELTSFRKRSFIRALNRVRLHGQTWYRGRLHTLDTLGNPRSDRGADHAATRSSRPDSQTSQHGRNQWRGLCWNAGGLSSAKLSEVELWLSEQAQQGLPIQVLAVQETHWSFSSEWRGEKYWYIHSRTGNRTGGILLMIHRSFVRDDQIRIDHVVPGRLLHVKLAFEPALEIITIYQHCWTRSSPSQTKDQEAGDTLDAKRERIWEKLQQVLNRVPWRSVMVLWGDFNTECRPMPPHVGPGILRASSPIPQTDHTRLDGLMERFGLTVLNSWSRRGHCATFLGTAKGKTHSTQIDFILTRQHHATPRSRLARPLWRIPFVPAAGVRHLPIEAWLPRPGKRHVPRGARPHRPSHYIMHQTLSQNPDLCSQLRETVHQILCTREPQCTEDLAEVVNAALPRAGAKLAI